MQPPPAAAERRRERPGSARCAMSGMARREFEQAARHVIAGGDEAQRVEPVARASRRRSRARCRACCRPRGPARCSRRRARAPGARHAAARRPRRRDRRRRRTASCALPAASRRSPLSTRRLPPVSTTIASVALSGSATAVGNELREPDEARRANSATSAMAASAAPRRTYRRSAAASWHARERAQHGERAPSPWRAAPLPPAAAPAPPSPAARGASRGSGCRALAEERGRRCRHGPAPASVASASASPMPPPTRPSRSAWRSNWRAI